jgi:hypothetical protein
VRALDETTHPTGWAWTGSAISTNRIGTVPSDASDQRCAHPRRQAGSHQAASRGTDHEQRELSRFVADHTAQGRSHRDVSMLLTKSIAESPATEAATTATGEKQETDVTRSGKESELIMTDTERERTQEWVGDVRLFRIRPQQGTIVRQNQTGSVGERSGACRGRRHRQASHLSPGSTRIQSLVALLLLLVGHLAWLWL